VKKINKNQEFINISNQDKQYKYVGKWPILYLDIYDKNGIWNQVQNKIEQLKDSGELNVISDDVIEKFLSKRIEIQFEIDFFISVMRKCIFFKHRNKVYCYTISDLQRKNGRKIYCRFYFDVNKVLSLDLPVKFI
jgi:hypothetical protein